MQSQIDCIPVSTSGRDGGQQTAVRNAALPLLWFVVACGFSLSASVFAFPPPLLARWCVLCVACVCSYLRSIGSEAQIEDGVLEVVLVGDALRPRDLGLHGDTGRGRGGTSKDDEEDGAPKDRDLSAQPNRAQRGNSGQRAWTQRWGRDVVRAPRACVLPPCRVRPGSGTALVRTTWFFSVRRSRLDRRMDATVDTPCKHHLPMVHGSAGALHGGHYRCGVRKRESKGKRSIALASLAVPCCSSLLAFSFPPPSSSGSSHCTLAAHHYARASMTRADEALTQPRAPLLSPPCSINPCAPLCRNSSRRWCRWQSKTRSRRTD